MGEKKNCNFALAGRYSEPFGNESNGILTLLGHLLLILAVTIGFARMFVENYPMETLK